MNNLNFLIKVIHMNQHLEIVDFLLKRLVQTVKVKVFARHKEMRRILYFEHLGILTLLVYDFSLVVGLD